MRSVPSLATVPHDTTQTDITIPTPTGHYLRHYHPPRGYRLIGEGEATISDRLSRIGNAMFYQSSACDSSANVVSFPIPTNFDNSIDAQTACRLDKESDEMAKQHRLRVIVGYDDQDQPIVKQIAATTETALADAAVRAVIQSGRIAEFMPDIFNKLTKPADQPQQKHKMCDYVKHWRRTYKQGIADNTRVFYDAKQAVILRYFGDMFIEDIKSDDVQRFLDDRAQKYKKKTVKDDLAFLRMVLDSAINDEIISRNVAKDTRIQNTADAGDGTAALTREQSSAIRSALPALEDDRERCLLALLVYTSMRREETLGLMWDDIDFEHGYISIRRALVYPHGKPTLKGTKTTTSERQIPMADQLQKILSACKQDSGYVICAQDGGFLTLAQYQKLWESLSQHIELYGATAINFRTTFATMSVASGVDIRTTQALMGHSDPTMTLRVYAKSEQTRLPAAVEKIDNFLRES